MPSDQFDIKATFIYPNPVPYQDDSVLGRGLDIIPSPLRMMLTDGVILTKVSSRSKQVNRS